MASTTSTAGHAPLHRRRTLCRLKQLPTAHQAWGDRRSSPTAACARCASSTSRPRCHSTVEYTSRPCARNSAPLRYCCGMRSGGGSCSTVHHFYRTAVKPAGRTPACSAGFHKGKAAGVMTAACVSAGHSGCTPTEGDSFVGCLSSEPITHLEAVGVQAAGVLESVRRLLVVHQLVMRAAHLAPHPRCSTGASPSSSLNFSTLQPRPVHTGYARTLCCNRQAGCKEHTAAKVRCILVCKSMLQLTVLQGGDTRTVTCVALREGQPLEGRQRILTPKQAEQPQTGAKALCRTVWQEPLLRNVVGLNRSSPGCGVQCCAKAV
jgi:hypothetical protein